MPTTTRTYLPTDWKVWLYEPVDGKFRLDFSLLDGADVLGGPSDTGGFGVQDFDITSIVMQEGTQFSQGTVFGQVDSSVEVSIQLDTINAATLSDFYSGRALAITLNNESGLNTTDFGSQVTPYFIGSIDSFSVTSSPFEIQHTLVLTGFSWVNQILNTQIAVTKATTSTLTTIQDTISDLRSAGKFPSDTTVNLANDRHFSSNGTQTASIGEWSQLLIDSTPGYPIAQILISDNLFGASYVRKLFQSTGLNSIGASGFKIQIPDAAIFNVELQIIGNDVINAVNLTSENGAGYTVGSAGSAVINNYSILETQIDVLNSTELKDIADIHQTFVPRFAVASVDVIQANTYQPITFFYDSSWSAPDKKYFYPIYSAKLGNIIQPALTDFGFTGYQNAAYVIGLTHEITKDSWKTNYQLWKGLN